MPVPDKWVQHVRSLLRGGFYLTSHEQKAVIAVSLIFLLGLIVRYWRLATGS
jgi:hypothetical protein